MARNGIWTLDWPRQRVAQLEQEKDPLESGVDIVAQPPGKKLQNLNLLSGGEKQMLAIEMVLRQSPRVALLDEPTGALAPDLSGCSGASDLVARIPARLSRGDRLCAAADAVSCRHR